MKPFSRPSLKKQLSNVKTLGVDKQLIIFCVTLLIFGLVMVANASIVDATRYFDDKFFYVKRQVVWAFLGLCALFICSRLDYRIWKKLSIPLLVLAIVLLIAVLIPGVGTKVLGAKRWIQFGGFVVQPAEFTKFALFMYLARLFDDKKPILAFLAPLGLILTLIMLEPDMGTATIIAAVSVLMYFASGSPIWHFLALIPVGVVALGLILLSPYRRNRLLTFLDPSSDPLGSSYHIRQILIALGSGGMWGVGLGQSRQKYLFLPEPATDSIFAIIGEELGFVGGAAVILAFAFFVWKGLAIAARISDPFGRLLAVGITAWIGCQAFVNLSAMVALVPLTGVPLPLISYGGSALIVNLAAIGILISISRSRQTTTIAEPAERKVPGFRVTKNFKKFLGKRNKV